MTVLDWRDGKRHWRGGHWPDYLPWYKLPLCIHCRRRTFLANDDGEPSHKTCQEARQDRHDA